MGSGYAGNPSITSVIPLNNKQNTWIIPKQLILPNLINYHDPRINPLTELPVLILQVIVVGPLLEGGDVLFGEVGAELVLGHS